MQLVCVRVCVQPSRAAGPAARAVRRSRLDASLPSVLGGGGSARAGAGVADGGGRRPFLAAAGGSGGDQAERTEARAALQRAGRGSPAQAASAAASRGDGVRGIVCVRPRSLIVRVGLCHRTMQRMPRSRKAAIGTEGGGALAAGPRLLRRWIDRVRGIVCARSSERETERACRRRIGRRLHRVGSGGKQRQPRWQGKGVCARAREREARVRARFISRPGPASGSHGRALPTRPGPRW